MAKSLKAPLVVVVVGPSAAPRVCWADYQIYDGVEVDPPKTYEDMAPNFAQTAEVFIAAAIAAIKVTEGV